MDRINRKCIMLKNLIIDNENALELILVFLGTVIFVIGLIGLRYNAILLGIIIIFVLNILQCMIKIKQRIYYLFFNITFFVFILSRPIISMFRGNEWWYFDAKSVITSLCCIYFSLSCLNLGCNLWNYYIDNKKSIIDKINKITKIRESKIRKEKPYRKNVILYIILPIFLLSLVCSMYIEIDKYIFMYGKSYEEYYTIYKNNVPYIINVFSGMLEISMCILLLLKPKKKYTILILSGYIITKLPMLLIGERGSIIKAILFSFLYFCFRNIISKKEVWIGKIEKILIIICIPLIIVSLGAFNYIRDDANLPSNNIFNLAVDFFYKQGVTFDVLCIGNEVKDKLPDKNYTFGGFIDYFKYNTISRRIFNIEDLGNANSVKKATQSNSYAHAMSYIAKTDYLAGHGWGSSYMLEVYTDYGYIGIMIYSIILGIFLCSIVNLLNKNNIFSLIALYSTLELFMVPRSEATGFLKFIVNIKFILFIIGMYIALKIFDKVNFKKVHIENRSM